MIKLLRLKRMGDSMTIFLLLIFCTTTLISMNQDEKTVNKTAESIEKLCNILQDMRIATNENKSQIKQALTNNLSSREGFENSFFIKYEGGLVMSINSNSENGRAQLREQIQSLRSKGYSQFKISSFSGEELHFEDDNNTGGENE